MLVSHIVADYRSFVSVCVPPRVDVGVGFKADIICITQITLKEIYNVLLLTIEGFGSLTSHL